MLREGSDIHNSHNGKHSPAKVYQSGPGRPASKVDASKNPLGSFLQEQLESRRITQKDLAQRLGISRDKVRRLISTDLIEIQSSLAERIVQVLDLNNAELEEFYKLLADNRRTMHLSLALPEEGTDSASATISEGVWLSLPREGVSHFASSKESKILKEEHPDERGRKAAEPETDIGRFLTGHLQARGMKRIDLARAAFVDPATITRLIQGKTAVIHDDTRERICQALGLDETASLEFDRLTAQGYQADISVHKFSHIDLDELAEDLQKLQGFYEKGYAPFVRLETRKRYRVLRNAGFSKKESRAIELQWCFGMLCGSADEAVLDWEKRVDPTITFYTMIEEEIRKRDIQKEQAEIYIAHIQARRAPLFRQLKNYQKSLDEFTEALNIYSRYLRTPEDRRLLVELYYSRAHVYAVQGMRDRWRRDIEQARMIAEREKDEKRRRGLVGLVVYTEGEGYKRLAFNESNLFSKEAREEFARKGIELFETSHMEESKWVGHRILNEVAQAQCMALIDPEAALKVAERLRTEAVQVYPSIVQKIDQIIAYARQHLY